MPAVDAKDSSSEIDSELAGSDNTIAMMHNPKEFNEEERCELTTDAIPTMFIIADLIAEMGKAASRSELKEGEEGAGYGGRGRRERNRGKEQKKRAVKSHRSR